MAIPVIGAGVGAVSIAAAIVKATTAIILYLTAKTVGRVLLLAAAVGAIIYLTSTLVTFFVSLIQNIAVTLPTSVTSFASALMPSNFQSCITIIISAMVAKWIYEQHVKLVSMAVSSNG